MPPKNQQRKNVERKITVSTLLMGLKKWLAFEMISWSNIILTKTSVYTHTTWSII
ncbi:hypothetical protein [Lederbergia citrea]|uniref:Uncharacterized protein n=1 Tax=Lederbergia citrea TaxID=2833581 RepID=A0A942UUW4_9BACI|nr:hypothetical protein [Lederbergia citrea]MBS4223329.1 hypothetical protein [Lederbergia citrea]